MKATLLSLASLLTLLPPAVQAEAAERPDKPNVVVLLIDDLGWQDVKCYDIDEPSPMETPHLDALAKKGVMFWQGYSPAPVCAPSRAAILSGLHPAHGDMTSVSGGFPPHPGNLHVPTISPYNAGRMPTARYTIAEALKAEGYTTAHSGKWHVSKNHYEYPKPFHHGFDFSTHNRGVQNFMKPDRLTEFATRDPKDPYRLDENGFPYDVPQAGALDFLKNHHDKPFFLYYATWLVHAPIVMRSEELLRKYEKKLGVTLTDEHKESWTTPGQTNPFYCAMVEQLDYYMGQIFTYLETTDDPRWPGHKLSENTYVIFTSDNGGMEGGRNDIYTDNLPLHKGKISVHEGGTRVPLIITGPNIPKNVQSNVMVNGLDFYPTILSLTGAKKPADYKLDGLDLSPLLTQNPTDANLVKEENGQVRDTMVWHFPQMENSSSIRRGDYKLVRKYKGSSYTSELYRLYDSAQGVQKRGDIEEKTDLSKKEPALLAELDALLSKRIKELGGRQPYHNAHCKSDLPLKEKAPTVTSHTRQGSKVTLTAQNNGAQLTQADLIYTPNNGHEWLKAPAQISDHTVTATLPTGTTHYFLNLIDENNFLRIHPPIDRKQMEKDGLDFHDLAMPVGLPDGTKGKPLDFQARYQELTAPQAGRSILLKNDFQDKNIAPLKANGKGISVIATDKDQQVLQINELDNQERAWMPMLQSALKLPKNATNGKFRVSFDFQLDPQNPAELNIALYDQSTPKSSKSVGGLVLKNRSLVFNRRNIAPLKAGTWYHLELSAETGTTSSKELTLTLTTADGHQWKRSIPYDNYHFDKPTSLQFVSLGKPNTALRLDNLVVIFEKAK